MYRTIKHTNIYYQILRGERGRISEFDISVCPMDNIAKVTITINITATLKLMLKRLLSIFKRTIFYKK